MTIRAFYVAAALAATALFTTSTPAFAQTTSEPSYELSAGYQLLHVPDQTFPFGVAVDAAKNFGMLSIVGELGWAYDSDDSSGVDASVNYWHYAAGLRVTSRKSPKAWPYGQILIGGATGHSSFELAGVDVSDTTSAFMVQPGVGVNVIAGDGWGVFGQVDYRRVFGDFDENEVRVFIGVRMILD